MKKLILAILIILSIALVGCGKEDTTSPVDNMTEEEKIELFNLMQENIVGEYESEDGKIFQVTPEGKFLYEGSSGLVSLKYNLVDSSNVEVIGADGKTKTEKIYFEDMGDKFKLEYGKETYYRNK
ncbi:hypothetical protein [uncultured Tyzzerella sp.]|uniref:hypothetical protein n=1 Tax=uncultured Tyzzerella sp. TaxID=2321398 RepID=UPI002942B1DC|nr:hypothetical protein [uncultured Tyzzerella sp.]